MTRDCQSAGSVASAGVPGRGADDAATARILVIDDDPHARLTVGSVLRNEGYVVEEAADGVAGIEAFKRTPPDVVLLDIVMPELDGFQTCREIRALPEGRYAPIVVITGLEDTGWIDTAFEAGATTFFQKPFNFDLLGRRLRYIIRSKRVYDRLATSEAQLANAQRLAKIGHWEWRRETGRVTCSRSLCGILGLPEDRATLSYADFIDLLQPSSRPEIERSIRDSIRQSQRLRLEHWVAPDSDRAKFLYQEAEVHRNCRGRITHIVGVAQDITERRRSEEHIENLAYFDQTTGLPNRSLLKSLLDSVLPRAKATAGNPAVLFIDLDNFKKFNDTFGHGVGDGLLREVGNRIVTSLRTDDTVLRQGRSLDDVDLASIDHAAVMRHGGDEFVVVLTDIRSAEDAATVARRIADVLSKCYVVSGREASMTASIGIALFPQDGTSAEEILKNAEAAMYDAKANGRRCHRFYSHHLQDRLLRKISLEADLLQAIERNELILHWQPKVDLRNGHVTGAEALLRWVKAGTIIPPNEFVPIAEETGLIAPIGEWVIRTASAQAAAWQAAGLPPLKVAVNLSALQFVQGSLEAKVADALRVSGLAPENLILELTESVLIDDIELSIEVLREIKALGVGISIDDFGTGYSSLSYLKRLPVSELKIDRSFVRNVPNDPNDVAIVAATIALAHNLKLRTVAEGVENHQQLEFLRNAGCDQVQGFLLSRPLPVDAFEDWLRTNATTIAA